MTPTPRRRSAGARRGTARRTTSRRRSAGGYASPRRRRTRSVSSTVGAAIGTAVVAALVDLSWPVRIALVGLVVVLGVGYLVWTRRAEIADGAAADQAGHPLPPAEQAGDPLPPADQAPPSGGTPA